MYWIKHYLPSEVPECCDLWVIGSTDSSEVIEFREEDLAIKTLKEILKVKEEND